jgi:hypothetical protein
VTATNPDIIRLGEIVDSLPVGERELFQRIYAVTTTAGESCIPDSMELRVSQHCGSVEAVINQKIVKVTNMVTSEGTLFNRLRTSRLID